MTSEIKNRACISNSEHKLVSWRPTSLIFGGLILGLVLGEVSLRVLYIAGEKGLLGLKPMRTTITWKEDPNLGQVILSPDSQGWFVTPSKEYYSWIKSNSEGFYDINHPVEKPANTFRIILLGDSFVADLQEPLQLTIAKQIEQGLNNLGLRQHIEVIALGLGNTGTAQQYIALKKIGLRYKPNLVVQMFLTANDVKNNSAKLQNDPYMPYFLLDSSSNLVETPHLNRSNKNYWRWRRTIKSLRVVELFLSLRQRLLEGTASRAGDYPIDYHIYDQQYNEDYQQAWEITKRLILATKKVIEENGGRYLLASLANNEQVNKDVLRQLLRLYPRMNNTDLEKPDKVLNNFCQVESIHCLFMLPFFQQYLDKHPAQPTHYKYDGHFNSLGDKLASEFLTEKLADMIKNHE